MKNWMLILLFCPWYVFSQGYIESIVVDGARTDAKAGGDGVYNISYAHGAGSYHFQIFHSDCTSSLAMSYTYISLPQSVAINGNNYNIDWHASFGEVLTVGQRVIVFSLKPDQHLRICAFVGGEGRDTPAGPISVSGIINFKELLTPGVIRLPPVTYFVGNVFANTKSEALDLLINYSDKGNSTVLYPNGDGELIIPEQCRVFDGSDKISIPMEDVPLGTKKSKRVLYTVECNSESAALKFINFRLYGQGGEEIQASPGRQELKIKMSNGSSANIRIMPLPNGKIVELPIDVTLDTTKGKCGDTEGSAILQYTLN
ncbi:hypothetical protein AT529_004722 [Escherichia coli]